MKEMRRASLTPRVHGQLKATRDADDLARSHRRSSGDLPAEVDLLRVEQRLRAGWAELEGGHRRCACRDRDLARNQSDETGTGVEEVPVAVAAAEEVHVHVAAHVE